MTVSARESIQGSPARASAPLGTDFDLLVEQGARLPPPESLGDAEVTTKLWEVIGRLAGLCVFLVNTDHLSDRQLYEQLWGELLREPPWERADASIGGCTFVDVVATGDRDGVVTWLRYYADDAERRSWQGELEDDGTGLPPRVAPPHDRDRYLPVPIFVKTASGGP
jgi:hypothetical protein